MASGQPPSPGRVRPEVVELLAYHHPGLSDFTSWPWTKLHHLDGRPFTAEELALANSATVEEAVAAQRLAAAVRDRAEGKRAVLLRLQELLTTVPGWQGMHVLEAASHLPAPGQEEVAELLSRYSLEELGLAGG